jgi:hypothetical protein
MSPGPDVIGTVLGLQEADQSHLPRFAHRPCSSSRRGVVCQSKYP